MRGAGMRGEPEPYRVPITRWQDAAGKRCKSTDPGAIQVRTESATYYADLVTTPGGPIRRVSLKTTRYREACQELKRLLRQYGYAARDASAAFADHPTRPIGEHVAEWVQSLRAGDRSEDRIEALQSRVEKLIALAGWTMLIEVSPDSAELALRQLIDNGLSVQTRNHYLAAAKQFIRWAWTRGRMPSHPLLSVKPLATHGRLRRERRCPTDDEIARLFGYLASNPEPPKSSRGPRADAALRPAHRALLYRVAMATGFRLSELRSLERSGIDLDAGTITVRAGYSKRRRTDTQHVPGWLVAELRAWLDAGGELFAALPRGKASAKMLQRDLAGAGIPYKVEGPDGPLYFDFHALRHHYITHAASIPGIDIKTLLELTRHSTPELTLRVYAKARTERVRAAVEQIPPPGELTGEPSQPERKGKGSGTEAERKGGR